MPGRDGGSLVSVDGFAVLLATALLVREAGSIMDWLRRTVSSDSQAEARPRSAPAKSSAEKLAGYHDLAKVCTAPFTPALLLLSC